MRSTVEEKSPHIPALDGVRGIAILMVMVGHAAGLFEWSGFQFLGIGWVGVDLFFVLSGFLITNILVQKKGTRHFFRNFYARRALRIWPVYYGLLLFTFVLFPRMVDHINFMAAYKANVETLSWPVYVLFAQNFFGVRNVHDMLLGVTWSLAVEEQYYLVWPLLVWLLRPKALLAVLATAMIASPLLRLVAISSDVSGYALYSATPYRLDGIAFGSALAIVLRTMAPHPCSLRNIGFAICAVGAWMSLLVKRTDFFVHPMSPIAYSGLALFFGGLLMLVLANVHPLTAIFSARMLRKAGDLSFCLYLVHYPIFILFASKAVRLRSHLPSAMLAMAAFLLAWLVASCSWRFLEKPVLGFKRFFQDEPRNECVAIAASVSGS